MAISRLKPLEYLRLMKGDFDRQILHATMAKAISLHLRCTNEIDVTEEQIYFRKQSPSQTAETAKKQIYSQEIWGGPPQNFMPSHIPKVQAFIHPRPLTADESIKLKRIEFTTKVEPDRGCIPFSPSWSIDPNDPATEREGLWNEDGYAKIKVTITDCNQVDDWRQYEPIGS